MYSGYNHYNRQRSAVGTTIIDPNNAWFAQEPHWPLIEDLIGGTYQMRSRHRKYLPQELISYFNVLLADIISLTDSIHTFSHQ